MKAWPLLVYGVGALLDAASTYAALLLVPGAFETNPRVAPLLFTPLHPLSELAAFAVMASLYLAGLLVERYNRKHGLPRLGAVARGVIHAAVAAVGALRIAATANNLLIVLAWLL
ncbi:MAG: hypothetical protein QXT79_02935 [Thermofilaceae archaeon]